jgi:hypothetical protein
MDEVEDGTEPIERLELTVTIAAPGHVVPQHASSVGRASARIR